jgi:hypothetical protein
MKKKILNTELSKLTGLSVVQVSYIITGASGCTRKTAKALSEACKSMGVTVPPSMWAYGDRDKLKTLLGR